MPTISKPYHPSIQCLCVQSFNLPGVNTFQWWIFFRGEYFSGVNLFQGWIFFRGESFSGVNIFQEWIFSGVNIWFSHNLLGYFIFSHFYILETFSIVCCFWLDISEIMSPVSPVSPVPVAHPPAYGACFSLFLFAFVLSFPSLVSSPWELPTLTVCHKGLTRFIFHDDQDESGDEQLGRVENSKIDIE